MIDSSYSLPIKTYKLSLGDGDDTLHAQHLAISRRVSNCNVGTLQ
jgi:hypothetical protein